MKANLLRSKTRIGSIGFKAYGFSDTRARR
jgi:hypothetical protein